jgi:hypothetical protein
MENRYRIVSVWRWDKVMYQVQYPAKFLGLIPYWKTWAEEHCGIGGCSQYPINFVSPEDAELKYCRHLQNQKDKITHHKKVVLYKSCDHDAPAQPNHPSLL